MDVIVNALGGARASRWSMDGFVICRAGGRGRLEGFEVEPEEMLAWSTDFWGFSSIE